MRCRLPHSPVRCHRCRCRRGIGPDLPGQLAAAPRDRADRDCRRRGGCRVHPHSPIAGAGFFACATRRAGCDGPGGIECHVIDFDDVSVSFGEHQVLAGVNLHVEEGTLNLVTGVTGAGKSTLLGCVNGLVPHFTGGTLTGRVLVDGRDTARFRPRDLSDVVALVGQDPAAGFVTGTVEDEIAYGMESTGVPADVMRRRVEETLDLLGIASLRARDLATLSGGQQQRVAIAAVLAPGPRVLVLDEPTSALDPVAAEEVLASITRVVHDLGLTVLCSEHRLERVIAFADTLITVEQGRVSGGSVPDA
ncbi:MAG: hypothetical protein CSB46_02420, partial [Micrococcales bacterium]